MQAALHIAPVLAAEKSHTAFYIAGGVLVAWALILALGLGLRNERFPGSLGGEHAVIAISAVLVLATLASAVLTSGSPAKAGETSAQAPRVSGEVQPQSAGSGATNAGGAGPGTKESGTGATTASPGTGGASAGATKAATGAGKGSSLSLAASPSGLLSFDTKSLSAKAGAVTITFTNSAPIEHDVTVAKGSTVLGATPVFTGGSKKLTLTLAPGTYTFYCSVPGHRQAGMEGTLKVS